MSSNEANPQLSEISRKLDTLIKLSALNLVREMKTQREQVGVLSDVGFQPKEIADILLLPRTTVNSVLYQLRKGKALKEGEEKPAPVQGTKAQNEAKTSTDPSITNPEREAE